MKHAWISALIVGFLALGSRTAHAAGLELQHEPVTCVPLDRYARISARGIPADQVASAELQFRGEAGGPWYTVSMTLQAEDWAAVLPRPTRAFGQFEYQIAMVSRGLESTVAGPYTVRVRERTEGCEGPAEASIRSSIVVRVPPGAPVVPPVPPGFSPAGAVAAQEREPARPRKTWLFIAAGGAAVGGALLVASGSSDTSQRELDIPTFSFEGTSPGPNSVLSLSRSSLSVFVRMSHEPRQPLTFLWRLDLRSAAPSAPLCLYMTGIFSGAQRPTGLVLSAPLNSTGACGQRYAVDVGRLWIDIQDRAVLDTTLTLPFSVEP